MFPLKTSTRIQEIILAVGPTDGSPSNLWTKGLIHCDFASTKVSGVYTFMLCLDKIAEENGGIQIWKDSKRSHHDPKNPSQGIEELVAKTLLGSKNTVLYLGCVVIASVSSKPNKLCQESNNLDCEFQIETRHHHNYIKDTTISKNGHRPG